MDTVKVRVGPVEVALIGDDRICHHIRIGNGFEPETLQHWSEMCEAGTTVLDVGSYTGLFAIAAAKLGAHAVAIEPLPFLQDRIAANAKLNGVSIEIIRAAASREAGDAKIFYNDRVPLTSGASLQPRNAKAITVPTIRIDDLTLPSRVSAMKIDVEHHEVEVIHGAANLLEADRPGLIVEVLNERARDEVEYALPRYAVIHTADKRNIILGSGRI